MPPPPLPRQMHYTWGSVFNAPNGTKVWEFDKRYYTEPKHEKTVRELRPGVGGDGHGRGDLGRALL